MPVVDFESAWYALKAHIASKRSHGATELAEKMASIEVSHRLSEEQSGFDDRPMLSHDERSSHEPSGESPEPLREPAQAFSGRS